MQRKRQKKLRDTSGAEGKKARSAETFVAVCVSARERICAPHTERRSRDIFETGNAVGVAGA
jgi:hypothetical protein